MSTKSSSNTQRSKEWISSKTVVANSKDSDDPSGWLKCRAKSNNSVVSSWGNSDHSHVSSTKTISHKIPASEVKNKSAISSWSNESRSQSVFVPPPPPPLPREHSQLQSNTLLSPPFPIYLPPPPPPPRALS